jgi:hypothetical protein
MASISSVPPTTSIGTLMVMVDGSTIIQEIVSANAAMSALICRAPAAA